MALTLTLRPKQDVYVGSRRLVLTAIESMNKAVLTDDHGVRTEITPFEWSLIQGMEGAEAMLGAPRDTERERSLLEARIQFNAPAYLVLRGDKYRHGKERA